jgi:hypothetical protein
VLVGFYKKESAMKHVANRTFLILTLAIVPIQITAMQSVSSKIAQKNFIAQLKEAVSSNNEMQLRSMLINALEKQDSDFESCKQDVYHMINHIGYETTRMLILTWMPATDCPVDTKLDAKIDTWLNFLSIFAPLPDPTEEPFFTL